jgi:hypothetical protein
VRPPKGSRHDSRPEALQVSFREWYGSGDVATNRLRGWSTSAIAMLPARHRGSAWISSGGCYNDFAIGALSASPYLAECMRTSIAPTIEVTHHGSVHKTRSTRLGA